MTDSEIGRIDFCSNYPVAQYVMQLTVWGEKMADSIFSGVNKIRILALGCLMAAFSTLAAEQPMMNLDDKEQLEVQSDLYWLTLLMWVLIIGFVVFAYSIRYVAKRTTRPCHWCSEFISNKATTCPRCGKKVETVLPSAPASALPNSSR